MTSKIRPLSSPNQAPTPGLHLHPIHLAPLPPPPLLPTPTSLMEEVVVVVEAATRLKVACRSPVHVVELQAVLRFVGRLTLRSRGFLERRKLWQL